MRVTIHQPEFAPWLGFFHKVRLADAIVLLDDVQYRKNYFQNRNRVRTSQGATWITIPVEHAALDTPIDRIRVATDSRWLDRIEKTLSQAYGRAPHFGGAIGEVVQRLSAGDGQLIAITEPMLTWMMRSFGLQQRIWRSSSFGIQGGRSERLLRLCEAVGATTYVSGISGREYLDVTAFERAGVAVEFQEFRHPIYEQLHPGFVPQMSALEALFLFGPDCTRLLEDAWPAKLDTVFA